MIKVYSKANCVACKFTKNWLKNNKLDFKEVNVEEDLEAFNELVAMNLRTLPVVFHNDELISVGFQPQNLKNLNNERI